MIQLLQRYAQNNTFFTGNTMNDIKPLLTNKKDNLYPCLFYFLGAILGFVVCIILFILFFGFAGNMALSLKEDFPIENVPTFNPSSSIELASLPTHVVEDAFTEPKALVSQISGDALYKFVQESPGHYQIVLVAKADYVPVDSRDEVLGAHSILSEEELIAGYQLMGNIMRSLFYTPPFSESTLSVSVRLAGLAQYKDNPTQIEIMYDGAQGTLPISLAENINWDGITLDEFRYLVSDYSVIH
jgi:hypothetical protein